MENINNITEEIKLYNNNEENYEFKHSKFNDYYNPNNLLYKCPLFLKGFYNNFAKKVLPVDTGIEIEASTPSNIIYSKSYFNNINLVENRSTISEQRLRLKSGIDGFISLWKISEILNEYFEKSESGIHYTIDLSEHYHNINSDSFKTASNYLKNWILNELDTWEYKGYYNKRHTSWFRYKNNFKAIEIRIGEMTFDYELLCKRIVHCHFIRKYIVNILQNIEYINYTESLKKEKLLYLKSDSLISNRMKEIIF